jgi:UbiA prenyltransferase family
MGILAFITPFFYLRCIGVAFCHPFAPWISFLIIWGTYLDNLTTDTCEDKFNAKAAFATGPKLYPIEKFYSLFYLVALIFAFNISLKCFLYALCNIAICLSYSNPWFFDNTRQKKRLKDFYIVKNVIPPLGWIFSVVIIPFVASGAVFIPEYLILIAMMFFFSFREEIKFDIPDTEGDRKAGIKTLPNTLGESQTRRIINLINYILTLLLFGTLLALWDGLRVVQFEALLKNVFPFLAAFVYDQGFTESLFKKKKKEYCNIGILWWVTLLMVYLILPYPYNIWVFIFLVLTGNYFAHSVSTKAYF